MKTKIEIYIHTKIGQYGELYAKYHVKIDSKVVVNSKQWEHVKHGDPINEIHQYLDHSELIPNFYQPIEQIKDEYNYIICVRDRAKK